MKLYGTFNYKSNGEVTIDHTTGFATQSAENPFVSGCLCQIDKSIPARQKVGTDGHKFAYTYTVFCFRSDFKGKIAIGDDVEIIYHNGVRDTFTVLSVDDTHPKYIEIWG